MPEYGLTEYEHVMFAGGGELVGLRRPEDAQRSLESQGYDSSTWERIVREKIGSHDTRTDAVVALGTQPRLAFVVSSNLRAIDHIEGWPASKSEAGIAPLLRITTMHMQALTTLIEETGNQHIVGR